MINRFHKPEDGYILYPGFVTSKNDGQEHFIGYAQLIELYKVNPQFCRNGNKMANWHAVFPNALKLAPRYDGDYDLRNCSFAYPLSSLADTQNKNQ